jgi:hypothetical protein
MWGREYHREIANRLFLDYEALLSEYRLKARVESLAIVLSRALEELKARPLEDLSTKELLVVIQQLDIKIRKEVPLCNISRENTDPFAMSSCWTLKRKSL